MGCKNWEYKDDKFVVKTEATTCKKLKTGGAGTMCNMPGSKATKDYKVKGDGCGACDADAKTKGLCGECKTAECNSKISSAHTVTAFVVPLCAALYALL